MQQLLDAVFAQCFRAAVLVASLCATALQKDAGAPPARVHELSPPSPSEQSTVPVCALVMSTSLNELLTSNPVELAPQFALTSAAVQSGSTAPVHVAPPATKKVPPKFVGGHRSPHSITNTADLGDDPLDIGLYPVPNQQALRAPPGSGYNGGGGTPLPPGGGVGAVPYRLREITIFPSGTVFAEPFTLQAPVPLPSTPQPLLVVFHKFGSSHKDVVQNTNFVAECARRGWFMVCPTGAAKKHFNSLESQINTEAVMEWILANPSLLIDRQRIYGIGFSMGGGSVTNYAARHLDPARHMFAAIVDHSGGVALNNTYYNDPPARFIFDFWFGDASPGSASPWKMNRSSVIDFDPVSLAMDSSSDLARNLLHIPLQIWRASNDPIFYVPLQCDVFDEHLRNGLGVAVGNTYSYDVVSYSGHHWTMIDHAAACDWLEQFTLQMPTAGNTLADRDGVYFQFFVEQDVADAFTPFSWAVKPATNELDLTATANLRRVTLDAIAAGLDPLQPLIVHMSTSDGLPDEVRLLSIPTQPVSVVRDGVTVFAPSWAYNPTALELTISEIDGGAHEWVINP